MITPIIKNEGKTVVFGPCRLSYTHLFSKYSPDGDPDNGKYMTNVLIPKDEKETVKALKAAIEAAASLSDSSISLSFRLSLPVWTARESFSSASLFAEISPIMLSALVRSVFPLRKARFVNSPRPA